MGKFADGFDFLSKYMTPQRIALLHNTIEHRTRYISVILEDINKPQNASAILRTCDCFGIQDVHLAENRFDYKVNKGIARGADKWLTVTQYQATENSTAEAISALKEKGYRIIATSPHATASSIHDLDLEESKISLLFGSERQGISQVAKDHADGFIHIPMVGFSESFNVSVTVALCLQLLRFRLEQCSIDWKLSVSEKEQLLFEWAKKTVRSSEQLLRLHYNNYKSIAEYV